MWPLIRDFFTTKSAAVRVLRLGFTAGGATLASAVSPLPEDLQWVGVLVAGIGGLITGPNRPNEEPKK